MTIIFRSWLFKKEHPTKLIALKNISRLGYLKWTLLL